MTISQQISRLEGNASVSLLSDVPKLSKLVSEIMKNKEALLSFASGNLKTERTLTLMINYLKTVPNIEKVPVSDVFDAMATSLSRGHILGDAGLYPVVMNPNSNPTLKLFEGYRAKLFSFFRSKWSRGISVIPIHEFDNADIVLGANGRAVIRPALNNRGELLGYVVKITIANPQFPSLPIDMVFYETRVDALKHKQDMLDKVRNKERKNDSAWEIAEEEMIKKTLVSNSLQFIPREVFDKSFVGLEPDDDTPPVMTAQDNGVIDEKEIKVSEMTIEDEYFDNI